ncbi:uncharacterized protein E0L32_003692 [Thyridium curvatum]|uniref:RRM domain-containing protein n=1 Tax=Thyridium curvatum TaxID=1093900 RepID=A0A507BID5_9PEZI|nr:uncharacterized protein E0L32_003692 [Thyridium curvatum]TPX16751.1 hypothetical protein E0L32_003692 [Thyridium curvatum]
MSYPGPPGVNSSHPSLPPRPPPGTAASKPKFSSTFSSSSAAPTTYGPAAPPPATSSYSSASAYSSAAAPPTSYGAAPTPRYGASSQPASSYGSYSRHTPVSGSGSGSYSQPTTSYGYGAQGYGAQQPQTSYGAQATTYGAPPQIRNPFPAPGAAPAAASQGGNDYDPDMAAQIAQWQSAYIPKDQQEAAAAAAAADPKGNSRAAGVAGYPSGIGVGTDGTSDATTAAAATAAAGQQGDKKKTVYRSGGGKQWADDTLLEWDPSHLRLFVGNLAGETTDESLLKAFSRWKSVQKAKVVRDTRTSKSRGFGFVSFSDPDDFFQAAKEMNGKYIQSHPVTVSKAKTEIRVSSVRDDKRGKKNDHRNKKNKAGGGGGHHHGGSGSGSGTSTPLGYEPHLGPSGGGVVKSGQKTKGGLKLLG